jgi:hypothetical protein
VTAENWDWELGRRIDHVFVRCTHHGPTLDCERIFDEPVDGVWGSDHFGVVVDLGPDVERATRAVIDQGRCARFWARFTALNPDRVRLGEKDPLRHFWTARPFKRVIVKPEHPQPVVAECRPVALQAVRAQP